MCADFHAWKLTLLARRRRSEAIILLATLLVVCPGCGDSGGRAGLTGIVTFDEKPVPEGSIEFHPIQGTKGPSSGGQIADGEFEIVPRDGLFPGTFQVSITAYRGTGKMQIYELTGEEYEVHEQYLPARYNQQSELSVEVAESGKNHFEFHLESSSP